MLKMGQRIKPGQTNIIHTETNIIHTPIQYQSERKQMETKAR